MRRRWSEALFHRTEGSLAWMKRSIGSISRGASNDNNNNNNDDAFIIRRGSSSTSSSTKSTSSTATFPFPRCIKTLRLNLNEPFSNLGRENSSIPSPCLYPGESFRYRLRNRRDRSRNRGDFRHEDDFHGGWHRQLGRMVEGAVTRGHFRGEKSK